jgi:diguanylate cyclase (GGDEF)-like protein
MRMSGLFGRMSFRNRIVALLVLLVVVAQVATFAVVNLATERSVELRLAHDLAVGERVWERFHGARGQQLLDSVSLLSADFGFKEAVASGDLPTMESALANHGARLGADLAVLLAPDGSFLADHADASLPSRATALGALIRIARRDGSAVGVAALDGRAFHVAVVPMLAPTQIAWVVVGVNFGAEVAQQYKGLTALDATFARGHGGGLRILASTLPEVAQVALVAMPDSSGSPSSATDATTAGRDRPSRALTVSPPGVDPAVLVVLQASRETAMAPFAQLRTRILALSALAALLALIVAGIVGRSVSRPVAELADAAGRIEQGDYSHPVATHGNDELARLARVFNRMQAGIAQREERIVHQAGHDGLTGLPNRSRALVTLDAAIATASACSGHCSVLMLDIDRFKEINDTLGHGFGDQVLVEVAKRLRAAVNSVDFVARLGGDEFFVLLPDIGVDPAHLRAVELVSLLHEPLRLPSTMINLDVSIGVASYPQHGEDAPSLLRRVDIAMYEAKARHAGVAVYQPGRDELHLRQVALMADLRRSIERGELHVAYQPKVELQTRAVRHAEALLRWTHPEFGPVRPDEFIPLAERSGFVRELSRFVLDHAIRQCRRWREAGMDIGVAVNLSAMDLMDVDLPDFVYGCLQKHGLEPARLILEVTESALMRDVNYAIRVLHRLRAGGVRIAIDDFGTGHSSLAQLRKLPVDELKIDKSFVLQLARQEEDAVIVRATIDLGHHMGLRVIAEGVEDARSLEMLGEFRCDMVQGFLFTPPLEPVRFLAWYRDYAAEVERVDG